jgi:hypothetical protein
MVSEKRNDLRKFCNAITFLGKVGGIVVRQKVIIKIVDGSIYNPHR